MNFKKGDLVVASACIRTSYYNLRVIYREGSPRATVYREPKGLGYGQNVKRAWRIEAETRGVIVGSSFRIIGFLDSSGFDQPVLNPTKSADGKGAAVKVIMIQPTNTERWLKPIPCLEEDLTLVEEVTCTEMDL